MLIFVCSLAGVLGDGVAHAFGTGCPRKGVDCIELPDASMPSKTVGSAPRVRDTAYEPLAPACVSSALTTPSVFDRIWFVACGRVHSSIDAGAGAGTDAIAGAPSFAAAPASVGVGIDSTGTMAAGESACAGTSEAAEASPGASAGPSAGASAGAAYATPVSNACADPDD